MCIKLSACVNFHIYFPLFQELRNDLHEAKVSRLDEEDVVSRVEAKLQATKEELKSTKERLTFREIEAEKAKADKTQLEEFKSQAKIEWDVERDQLASKIANLEQEVPLLAVAM